MKLDETTIDDEKENTCNGNGLPGKPINKEISSGTPNGDLHNDTGSNETAAGVGDLLVEDTNPSRNDSEENCFQNGNKADDSTSVSSSSSNFPITDFQQDDLSDDYEMTLRLSEDDELSGTNETDNLYFTSSPFPKGEEESNKKEAASTSAAEEKSNSELVKETDKPIVEEKTNNKISESECDEKTNSDKSDDNLENLISDLNEDSKSAIKSANKKVTISDLRQEIEDFIKNHDTEDVDSESKDSNPGSTKNDQETKSDKTELNIKIPEIKSVETVTKLEINDIKSVKTEILNEESEIKDDLLKIKDDSLDFDDESLEIKDESLGIKDEAVEITLKEILKAEETSENPDEKQNNNSNSMETELECSAKINIEPSTLQVTEILEENSGTKENAPENVEKTDDENISGKINFDDSGKKSVVEANKQSETMNTNETNATEHIEINKTKESDTLICQKDVDDSEKNDKENLNKSETAETENSNLEIEEFQIIRVENNIEETNITIEDNIEEEKNKEYTELKNVFFEPMDVELNETESGITETEINIIEKPTIINDDDDDDEDGDDDDVLMQEDFDNISPETDNKVKTNNQEEKLVKKQYEDTKGIKSDAKKQDVAEEENIKGSEDKGKREEERTSLKRTLDNEEETQDAKKPKINGVKKPESEKEYVRLDIFREFMSKKEISTLTRAEIEQFCLQKMCEAITQSSKIGELNRKIIQQETMLEALRTKYASLTKQVRDLEVVHSRVLQEVRAKAKDGNIEVTPVKITRSVGLQVSLQPIAGRVRQIIPVPEVMNPGLVKRKIQRTSLPNKLPSSSPSSSMPPPAAPPIHKSPSQGKGIKTILPKVYPPAESKDSNSTLLGTYLQSPSTSKNTNTSTARKPTLAPTPSTSAGSSDSTPKVIDLTDEDDTQKASSSSSTGNIRVVPSQQLQNTTQTPVTTGSLPRLTYLVQGNQQGQQVLLATSTAPTRPGQVRSTLMFKPVAPGQVPAGQRLNIVRPNTVPGITVLPSTSSPSIRPGQQIRFATPLAGSRPQVRAVAPARHPAPLPGPPAVQPSQPNWKAMPPKPTLKISRVGDGIVLSWRMQNNKDMSLYEDIGSYQLYAYQETSGPPSTDMWRKVGDVKALALPMACTLTQFTDGNKYHFAVRAVDVKSRVGPFSQPEQIALP